MVTSGLTGLAHDIGSAAVWLWRISAGLILDVGGAVNSKTAVVAELNGSVKWLVGVLALASVIIQAARLGLTRNGAEPAFNLVRGLLVLVLAGAIVPIVVELDHALQQLGHGALDWAAQGGNVEDRVGGLIGAMGATFPPGIVIFLGPLVILGIFASVLLAVIRGVALILLLGVFLPLTAATAAADGGYASFKRCLGWTGAWLMMPFVSGDPLELWRHRL